MPDFLSQNEIDAIISSTSFDENEMDTIGEIGNICMGMASDTLSKAIGGTPTQISSAVVDVLKYKDIVSQNEGENIAIRINYTSGISGNSILIISKENASIIANLMMGNTKGNFQDIDNDILISAACETMNQMMGSAVTTLATIMHTVIDIAPPETIFLNSSEKDVNEINPVSVDDDNDYVKLEFELVLEDYLNSKLILIFDINSAKFIIDKARQEEAESVHDNSDENNVKVVFEPICSDMGRVFNSFGMNDGLMIENVVFYKHASNIPREIVGYHNILNNFKEFTNTYLFHPDLIEYTKGCLGLQTEDDEWDVLRELNASFSNILINNFDNIIDRFDEGICNKFIDLKEDKYCLIEYILSGKKIYQIISKSLVDKLISNRNKNEQPSIDVQNHNVPSGEQSDKKKHQESTPCIVKPVFAQIPIDISVVVGKIEFNIKNLLFLNSGSMLTLNKKFDEPVDVYANNKKIAEGEILSATYTKTNVSTYAVKLKKIKKG